VVFDWLTKCIKPGVDKSNNKEDSHTFIARDMDPFSTTHVSPSSMEMFPFPFIKKKKTYHANKEKE